MDSVHPGAMLRLIHNKRCLAESIGRWRCAGGYRRHDDDGDGRRIALLCADYRDVAKRPQKGSQTMSTRTTIKSPRRAMTSRAVPATSVTLERRARPAVLPHELELIDVLRSRLVADLKHLTAAATDKDPTALGFDSMVTAAQSSMRFETDDILRSRIERRLLEVRKVEAKLRDGSYGVCDMCGEDIDPERLEAIPDTTHCMPCQVASERKVGVAPGGATVGHPSVLATRLDS